MYKVIKPKGVGSTVTLENTDTKANVIIGGISVELLHILEVECSLKAENGTLVLANEWNFTVNAEVAGKLAYLTMKTKKPVRIKKFTQEKNKNTQEVSKQMNKQIDAVDVLLGIANYI